MQRRTFCLGLAALLAAGAATRVAEGAGVEAKTEEVSSHDGDGFTNEQRLHMEEIDELVNAHLSFLS